VAGVTVLELMIVVATVAILAAIAVPRYTAAREATHSGAAHQAMVGSLMIAASHAASTGVEVVLCPGAVQACRPSNDWSGGWIVFADLDGDRTHDAYETVLRRVAPLGGRARLRSTVGRTRLVFQPNGTARGSNVTFTLCDGRGPSRATALVMDNLGRLRASTATEAAARTCMA
jgi:type IV fimbrial biogenesis protein FimT